MKNKKTNWRALLITVIACLAFSLVLTGCDEDTTLSITLRKENSSAGVDMEGATVFMKVGDKAALSSSLTVDEDITMIDTKDNYIVSAAWSEHTFVLEALKSGTCNLDISYKGGKKETIVAYVRNAECASCENEFSEKVEYENHTIVACGHKCLNSVAEEHAWCNDCNMLACADGHDHNATAPCGHKVSEASGEEHKTKAPCGAHYMCTGANHTAFLCGHYTCTGEGNHSLAACQDHYVCDGKVHTQLDCADEHLGCDSDYGAQECGHCLCEGEHFICSVCESRNCDNLDVPHERYYCGHVLCNDQMEEGHIECEHCGDCIEYGTHSATGCVPPQE